MEQSVAPLKPPFEDLALREIAYRFYDSPDKVQVQECLDDAEKDDTLGVYRKESFDARKGSRTGTRLPELITYKKTGEGTGTKNLGAALHEAGKKLDKDTAEKLLKLVEKSDAILELVKNSETLAYVDVLETLLNRLNYLLHGDHALWKEFGKDHITFGPFAEGKSACSYRSLCLYWETIDKAIPDLKWQETKLSRAMEVAEDKYLDELARAGVSSIIDGEVFRKEVYLYVTQVKASLDRNVVAHEFGTAVHSFLAPPSRKVRLMENFPASVLDSSRRTVLTDKLQSLNSPPKGVENIFVLQKEVLKLSLQNAWRRRTARATVQPPKRGNSSKSSSKHGNASKRRRKA